MVERLVVAVLSLTGRNKACADAFFENPRVEIVAVTEDDPPPATSRTTAEQTLEAGRRWALERGVPFVDDLEEVLGRSDVQAVTFSSRFERRVALVEMMADAGKHVFADKPLTATRSDGDAIIDIIGRHDVKMSVGHNYRFNPAILRGARVAPAGRHRPALGDTQSVDHRRRDADRARGRAQEPRHVSVGRAPITRRRTVYGRCTPSRAHTSSKTPRGPESRTWDSSR